ncbi:MAG TPA: hypothetical protein VIX73_27740, partial [Kofleriaceae bacterium]
AEELSQAVDDGVDVVAELVDEIGGRVVVEVTDEMGRESGMVEELLEDRAVDGELHTLEYPARCIGCHRFASIFIE